MEAIFMKTYLGKCKMIRKYLMKKTGIYLAAPHECKSDTGGDPLMPGLKLYPVWREEGAGGGGSGGWGRGDGGRALKNIALMGN